MKVKPGGILIIYNTYEIMSLRAGHLPKDGFGVQYKIEVSNLNEREL